MEMLLTNAGRLQVQALTEEQEQGAERLANLQAQCTAGIKALSEQRTCRAELESRCCCSVPCSGIQDSLC